MSFIIRNPKKKIELLPSKRGNALINWIKHASSNIPYFPEYPPNSSNEEKIEPSLEQVCWGHYAFCKSKEETPPLFVAAESGNTKMMDTLLHNGHKINAQDAQGETALLYACRENKYNAVDFLLSRGAQSDVPNWEGVKAEDMTLDHEISLLIRRAETLPPHMRVECQQQMEKLVEK